MSAQAAGVLGVGTEPPPDSTLPRLVGGDLGGVGVDARALGLGHLADLLLQGHPAEQVGDPLAVGSVGSWYGRTSAAEAVRIVEAGAYSGSVPATTAIEASRTAVRRPLRRGRWLIVGALPAVAALTR